MSRFILATLSLAVLLSGIVPAAWGQEKNDKDGSQPKNATVTQQEKSGKDGAQPKNVTISHVDAKKGSITLKYLDPQGKSQEKTFRLTSDVRLLDETGRLIQIDVFEAGNEALVVEHEGQLREVRRMPGLGRPRSLSHAVRTLIELADTERDCADDLQKIYDMLHKLDTGKNGKIDPQALKAEAGTILRERVQEVFSRLDVNKDGKISRDEARGMVKEHFDRIDTNRDGFIPLDELMQAARERHEHQTVGGKQTDSKSAEKEKN